MFALEGKFVPGVAFGKERFAAVDWARSPVGPVSAIFRFDVEGRLTAYTAVPAYVEMLRAVHRVHAVKPGPVRARAERDRFLISAEPDDAAAVEIDLALGTTAVTCALNLGLALTPRLLRESELYVRASNPVVTRLLDLGPGCRFAGRTEIGTPLVFATRSLQAVKSGRASVGGADCGLLRAIDDPVDWGEFKMSRRPYVVDCRMMIGAPLPDLVRGPAKASAEAE